MNLANNFKPKYFTVRKEFEFILSQIIECYKLMYQDITKIDNDENIIRNRLHKDYLDNQTIVEELNIEKYFFDIEPPFVNNDYRETARFDIKIYNSIERMRNRQSSYYIIECKRLDGVNIGAGSLNYKYVENGIKRFTSREDYPVLYGVNAMIGFIVKKKPLDKIVKSINKLLTYKEALKEKSINENFKYSYLSQNTDGKIEFELYHLMFNFSSKIN
jgi:hypothetical protein